MPEPPGQAMGQPVPDQPPRDEPDSGVDVPDDPGAGDDAAPAGEPVAGRGRRDPYQPL
nr:hypothetical protein [Micromonospora sp. DSM 115978]